MTNPLSLEHAALELGCLPGELVIYLALCSFPREGGTFVSLDALQSLKQIQRGWTAGLVFEAHAESPGRHGADQVGGKP